MNRQQPLLYRHRDPVLELLLAADLPAMYARARGRAAEHRRAGEDTLARAWSDLAAACHDLMPVVPDRHGPVQLPLFPLSRGKSSTEKSGTI